MANALEGVQISSFQILGNGFPIGLGRNRIKCAIEDKCGNLRILLDKRWFQLDLEKMTGFHHSLAFTDANWQQLWIGSWKYLVWRDLQRFGTRTEDRVVHLFRIVIFQSL